MLGTLRKFKEVKLWFKTGNTINWFKDLHSKNK